MSNEMRTVCKCLKRQECAPQMKMQWRYCGDSPDAPQYKGEPMTHCPWCGIQLVFNMDGLVEKVSRKLDYSRGWVKKVILELGELGYMKLNND